MSVTLNHAIVFAEDKYESASFFTNLFGLPEASSWGPFRVVELDNDGSVLFAEPGVEIQPQHLAFLVAEEDFDGVYERMLEAGLEHWADPRKSAPGTFNTNHGGRGRLLQRPGRPQPGGPHASRPRRRVDRPHTPRRDTRAGREPKPSCRQSRRPGTRTRARRRARRRKGAARSSL